MDVGYFEKVNEMSSLQVWVVLATNEIVAMITVMNRTREEIISCSLIQMNWNAMIFVKICCVFIAWRSHLEKVHQLSLMFVRYWNRKWDVLVSRCCFENEIFD